MSERCSNCKVTGESGSTITGMYLNKDLEGDNIGGLIGFLGEGDTTITGCSVNNISVEGTREVGGLIGSAYTDNNISNCKVTNTSISSNATAKYISDNLDSAAIGGLVGLYIAYGNDSGKLTGCTVSGVSLSTDFPGVQMGYITGGQRGTDSIVEIDNVTQSENKIVGSNQGANNAVFVVGSNAYLTIDDAIEDATGDVTITVIGIWDISGGLDSNNSMTLDLSDKKITDLTIQGSNDASILSGVDGHYIDGENGKPRCPVLNFSLPNDAALNIEDITFEDDLWIDNDSGSVTFTGCIFHGAISAYPQSVDVTFDKNKFQFDGTASSFYSGNAYPVWFKIEENTEFKFTNNVVTGPRGVHIENRPDSTTDITVTGNMFTLDDDGNVKKTTALQLVNTMPGKIVFTNNVVDAYMAICLYNGVTLSGTIESHDNTLSTGCKEFGTSEWSENVPEGFVESLLQARIGYTYYPSLEAALGAVANSDKRIVLVNDVNLDKMLDINVEGVVIDLDRHTISASESFTSTYDNDSHLINIGHERAPVNGVTIENGEIVATSKNKNPINIFDSEGIVLRDLVINASKITEGAPLVVSSGSVTLGGEVVFIGGPWDYSVNMGSGTNATRSEVSVATKPDTVLRFNGVRAGFYADQGSGTEASLTFGEGTEYYYDKTPFILLATSTDSNVDEGVYQPIDRVENPLYVVSIDVTPSDATVTIDGTVVTGDSIQLEAGSYNVSVSMPGYITQQLTLRVGSGMSNAIAVDLEVESDVPVIPPVDDDDDYVPPIYVPSDTSSSDDDTVKIVACAAAAVVAAIMAAFLILGHRRD